MEERNNLKGFLESDASEEEKKKKVEACNPGFWVVRTMSAGESFGEIALQAEGDRIRTATVICKEDTLFAVLTREDFNAILAKVYERKKFEKIAFLRELDVFSHWTYSDHSSLLHHLETETHQRNITLLREGEIASKFYIILEGEVEVIPYSGLLIKEKQDNTNSVTSLIKPFFYEPKKSTRLRSPEVTRCLKLAILGSKEYFGEASCLNKSPSEYTAVVSSTRATFLTITREKFARFIKDPKSIQILEQHILSRKEWHKKLESNFKSVNKGEMTNNMPKAEKSNPRIFTAVVSSETSRPIRLKFQTDDERKSILKSRRSPVETRPQTMLGKSGELSQLEFKSPLTTTRSTKKTIDHKKISLPHTATSPSFIKELPLEKLIEKTDENFFTYYKSNMTTDRFYTSETYDENDPEVISSLNFMAYGIPAGKKEKIKLLKLQNITNDSEENLKIIQKSTTLSNLDSARDKKSYNILSTKYSTFKMDHHSYATPIDELILKSIRMDDPPATDRTRVKTEISDSMPTIFKKTGFDDIIMARKVRYGGHQQVLKKGALRALYGQLRTISRVSKK